MGACQKTFERVHRADRIVRGICTPFRAGPLVSEALPLRGLAGSDLPDSAGLRILVAEDDEWNALLMKELLKQRGHQGRFVSDGGAAVAAACADHFDLMLLDLHMPDMDGFEVVRAVREQERNSDRHLPIIAVTARAAQLDRERCFAAGVDAFVPKPFERDALWEVVHRVVVMVPQGHPILFSPV